MENMEQKLQYLLDRLAIEDQIKHYAHLIDSKQFDRLYDVMAPGAWMDYSVCGGEKCSVEEMIGHVTKSMAQFRSQHLMTNVEVCIAPDRRTAQSTHILFNPMTMDMDGRDYTFFCGLHYDCDWILTEDEIWKITKVIQRDCYTYHRPLPTKKK